MADSVWDLFVRLTADTAEFKQSMGEAAETLHGFQEKAEQIAGFGEKLLMTEGLRELGVEALTAFGHVQKAQIALAAMTGSAEEAAHTIEGLKEVALSDALSFPALVQAQQRMIAFGFSAQQIPSAIQAIADAAGATDKDFDSVAASVERMGLSGVASGKALAGIGLSVTDLAEVLGIADEEVKKVFKSLDQGDRLEAITLALQKFQGVGAEVAQGILGQWTNVKTQFDFVLEDIGKGIAPVVGQALGVVNSDILPFVRSLAEGFTELPAPIRDTAAGLALAAVAATAMATAVAGFELVGMGAAFVALGAAALAAAPWIALVGTAVAALHFSGAAEEAMTFAEDLRRNLPGLADLVQPLIDRIKVALDLFHLLPSALPGGGKQEEVAPDAGVMSHLFGDSVIPGWLSGTGVMETAMNQMKTLKDNVSLLSDEEEHAALESGVMAKKILEQNAATVLLEQNTKAVAAELAKMFSAVGQENFGLTLPAAENAFASLTGSGLLGDEQILAAADKLEAKLKSAFDAGAISADTFHSKIAAIEDSIAEVAADVDAAKPKLLALPEAIEQMFAADPAGLVKFEESLGMIDATQAKLQLSALAAKQAEDQMFAVAQRNAMNFLNDLDAVNQAEDQLKETLARQNLTPEGIPVVSKELQGYYDAMNKEAGGGKASTGAGDFKAIEAEHDALLKHLRVTNQESVEAMIADNEKLQASYEYTDQQRLQGAINTDKAILAQAQSFRLLLAEQLRTNIARKAETGTDATSDIVQLERLRLATKAAADAATNLGSVYVGLRHDLDGAFDGLTKGIADNLIEWKDWGDALINIGKNVAKNFAETMLTGLLNPLKNGLDGKGGVFDGIAGSLTKGLGSLLHLGGGAVGDIANAGEVSSSITAAALKDALGPTVSAVGAAAKGAGAAATSAASAATSTASAAGSAASSATGLLSSIGSIANIAGAVAAIGSGITQGIQQAHANNLLGEIEISTRQVKEQLVGGIQPTLNQYLPELLHITNLWAAVLTGNDHLADIAADVGRLPQAVSDLANLIDRVVGNLGGDGNATGLPDLSGPVDVNVAEWGGGTANVPTAQVAPDDSSSQSSTLPAVSPEGGKYQANEAHTNRNALNQIVEEQPVFEDLATAASDATTALSLVAPEVIRATSAIGGMGLSLRDMTQSLQLHSAFTQQQQAFFAGSGPQPDMAAYAKEAQNISASGGNPIAIPLDGAAVPLGGTYSPDQIQAAMGQFSTQLSALTAFRDAEIQNQNATISGFRELTASANRQLLIGAAKAIGDTRVQGYIDQAGGNLDAVNWDLVKEMLEKQGGGGLAEAAWAAKDPWSAFADPSKLRAVSAGPIDPNTLISQYYTRLSTAGVNYNGSTILGSPGLTSGGGTVAQVTVNALNQSSRAAADGLVLALKHLNISAR